MPQKIDFEPISFEPIGGKIDFEPIQFEPVQTGKSHGWLADNLWNAGSRIMDIGRGLLQTPAADIGFRPSQGAVQDFGNRFGKLNALDIGGQIDPTGTISGSVSGSRSLRENIRQGNYGGAVVDAGLLAAGPVLGFRSLLKQKPVVNAPEPLPVAKPIEVQPRVAPAPFNPEIPVAPVNRSVKIPANTFGPDSPFPPFVKEPKPPVMQREFGISNRDFAQDNPILATVPNRLRPEAPNVSMMREMLPSKIRADVEKDRLFGPPPKKEPVQFVSDVVDPVTREKVEPIKIQAIAEKVAPKTNDLKEALALARAVITTGDFGALMRQGSGMVHTKAFWKNIDQMFKSFGSEKASAAIRASIDSDEFVQKNLIPNGLHITDLKSLTNREEDIMSSWIEDGMPLGRWMSKGGETAEKVGDVLQTGYAKTGGKAARAFNRAHTDFLNKVRIDQAKRLYEVGKKAGMDFDGKDLPEWQKIVEGINIQTGRGTFGKVKIPFTGGQEFDLNKAAPAANLAMLAPRYTMSQFQMLNPLRLEFNPFAYLNGKPSARKEQMKSLIASVAFGMGMRELYKSIGGQAENVDDPSKSTFGKIKFGDRIYMDPFAGKQQIARLGYGLADYAINGLGGDLKGYTGPFDKRTAAESLMAFGRGKLAPIPSFLVDAMTGKEMSGIPFTMKRAIAQRAMPIIVQDLNDIIQSDPEFLPLIVPMMFGQGGQVYSQKPNQNASLLSR